MNYYVYILESERTGRYYVGSTNNPMLRLERHNAGFTRSTKGRGPWKTVYLEKLDDRCRAVRREQEIKRMKNRKYIKDLLEGDEVKITGS